MIKPRVCDVCNRPVVTRKGKLCKNCQDAQYQKYWKRRNIMPGDAIRLAAIISKFVVIGELPSMKNRRRILKSRITGKPFSAKSEAAVQYAKDFVYQVPPEYRELRAGSFQTPLRLVVSIFHRSWRSDVDIELLKDCLQAAGVVSNDRWIPEVHVYGAEIDAKNPRCEVIIEEI